MSKILFNKPHGELLGKGSYGAVYKKDGVAIKIYNKSEFGDGVPCDAIREIAILLALNHNNIAHIISVEMLDDLPRVAISMELASMGSLDSALEKRNVVTRWTDDDWSMRSIYGLLLDMWTGISYMHENGIIHRDIKPCNMLLFNSEPHKITLKITDFGGSIVHIGKFDEPRTDPITTLWYRSPEVAFGLKLMHGPAMDVWSGGLVMSEIIIGCRPLFVKCLTNWELKKAICYKFGTPTLQNNLMPSYYAGRSPSLPPPSENIHQAISPVEMIYSGMVPGEPFYSMTNMALCMEPTRRASASWMIKRLVAGTEGSVPFDRRVSSAANKRTIVSRMVTAPEAFPNSGNIRSTMGTCLFAVCVRMSSDSSRRVFHAAAAILDRLMTKSEFVSRQMVSNREMIKSCMGIMCVASKLCESRCITPGFIVGKYYDSEIPNHAENADSAEHVKHVEQAESAEHAKRQPFEAPHFDASELMAAEMLIIKECGWDLWIITPMDVASGTCTSDPNMNYTRNYIVDIICCYIGSGGYSPVEVDLAASYLTTRIMDKEEIVVSDHVKTLASECENVMESVHGSIIYLYYSTDKRHAVSTMIKKKETMEN